MELGWLCRFRILIPTYCSRLPRPILADRVEQTTLQNTLLPVARESTKNPVHRYIRTYWSLKRISYSFVRIMPNLASGFLCFGPATFVSVAFILSQFGQQGCSFLGNLNPDKSIFDRVDTSPAYAGLYCWQGVNGGRYLYGVDFDGLQFARQTALATTIMGAVVWCFYVFSSCIKFHPAIWFVMSLTLLATTVTQALQFQLFNSDRCSEGCTLGTSSRLCISACVFWFVSALMTCGEYC